MNFKREFFIKKIDIFKNFPTHHLISIMVLSQCEFDNHYFQVIETPHEC